MRAQREQRELLLLQKQAGDMLRLGFGAEKILRSWKIHRIHHRPGAGVSVGYSVIVDDKELHARRSLYVVASTARIAEGKLQQVQAKKLRMGATSVYLWEYPYDPELPALPLACDPEKMGKLLAEPVDLELLGYRPTRRAILRIDRKQASSLYAKVVPPARQADLEQRMRLMEEAGVGAPLLFHREAGLVIMTAVPGISLARYFASLANNTDLSLFTTTLWSLREALAALPVQALDLPARPAWAEKCEHYGMAAALRLPAEEKRCLQAAADIRQLLGNVDLGPQVVTHGDFYEANICVQSQDGRLSGLLDLDSLGPGRRVFDWGCLLGHMSVLYYLAPHLYPHIPQLVEKWFQEISGTEDGAALATAAAGVTLSLIAGARKNGKNGRNVDAEAKSRLRITEEWIAAAYMLRQGRKPTLPSK